MKIKFPLDGQVSNAPLITFRVLFGFMMALSIARFTYRGWIEELYIKPTYYFTYYGLDWIKPLSSAGMYLLFMIMFLSAIGIMIGYRYRLSAISFFLSFTYVELIDKTNYLNHYYFVSLVAFLLIFVPAQRRYSIDVQLNPQIFSRLAPSWTIGLIKAQLILVYFFAGVAKLNYDWMVQAMPMKLWLPSLTHVPVIGGIFNYEATAYAFSWAGAVFDLSIGLFLLIPSTRIFAYLCVVVFHTLTALLFPIGMFPYIMMVSTLIFFSPKLHEKALRLGSRFKAAGHQTNHSDSPPFPTTLLVKCFLGLYLLAQILVPLRSLAYPGSVFWSEQGYRFSWRVMLMEKAGHTYFKITDRETEQVEWATNYTHLTAQQEKMMCTQPDMILQYAHHLKNYYHEKGFIDPQVFCFSKVTLNGRRSQVFINPKVDLALEQRSMLSKHWIMPLAETNRL